MLGVIKNVNLIIVSSLSTDPPSEGLYFRYFTMMAKKELNCDVVIEAEKKATDFYYHFLKEKGWFDFIDDFVTPQNREMGIRIDTELHYPLTIQTHHIRCDNAQNLLSQVKFLKTITF